MRERTMTHVAIGGVALLGFLLIFACTTHAHARHDADTLLNSSELLAFDIPVQPLGDALDTFSRLSQLSVLLVGEYPGQAPAVRGRLTRKQALAGLLAGSGLVAYFVDDRSIVVRPPEPVDRHFSPSMRALELSEIPGVLNGERNHGAYVASVQRAVRDALCASSDTRPGGYRLAMQLWLDAQGRVGRLNLLGTTGQARRDRAIARKLSGLSVHAPPAAGLPQPILMVLLPASGSARLDCPAPAGR